MKKIILTLISIILCSCATSQYTKQLKVDLNPEYNLMIEFIDADSNGVFDYMNNDITYKNGTSYYKCKTNNIEYKINRDSTNLTEKDISEYLRNNVYRPLALNHGMFKEELPPSFGGTIGISDSKRPAMNFCDILIKEDTLVTIVCPAGTEGFDVEAWKNQPPSKLKVFEEKIGKSIFELTEDDVIEINIDVASDGNSIIVGFSELVAKCCEWVELYDFNGEKKFEQKLNNRNKIVIPTLGFQNGSYILRLVGYDFVDYYTEDRVVIISR